MKSTVKKFAGLVAGIIAFAQAVEATPISGTIGFTGRVSLNTGTTATASQIVSWINPTVNGTSGDFATIADGTAVTIKTPWSFDSGAVASFWKVGGFTFDLISSSITSQGGNAGTTAFVNVSGIGTVSGNGFSSTTIVWNFSTQDPAIITKPSIQFTFSASNVTIPDGGATIALLGLAFIGAGLLRKQFAA